MDFYKKVGERVKKLRESFGLPQEKVAKLLKVSRVSISQIESGTRKVTAEEIAKLAAIFNIDADILLDLKKDFIVSLESGKETLPEETTEIRISVPQENLKKFREVLLYILNKVGSKANIGETVLYKLLYFIDFDYYEKHEEQLIGAAYQKNHYGPTPIEFAKVVENMKDKGDLVEVQSQYFHYPQRKYMPVREPDISMLSADEIKTIDEVLERLSDMNAAQISEYSHGDVPWRTTQEGKIIDYESVFYRASPYSVRKYNDNAPDIF